MVQYYKPADGWAADFIPFYWEGQFWLFYLHDYRDIENHGEGTPWRVISTKDFITFTEHGEVLARGAQDEQDLFVFTGSVVHHEGVFHIFYTGHNPHLRAKGLPEQAVMHATSPDLIHWTKVPEDTFFAPLDEGYEPHDWRDPFVFADEGGKWHMLLAARLSGGPAVRSGCTAHCTSDDLITWHTEAPLWAPDLYYTHECPDYFQLGAWHYLIYSEFSDRSVTRYVMSKSLQGPWTAPADDVFDTRAYYAAKSVSDGKKRYLFGWNPTKVGDRDVGRFMWGGSLVVHEIYQRGDGTLAVREPQTLKDAYRTWQAPTFVAESGTVQGGEGMVTLAREDGMACAVAQQQLGPHDRICFDITPQTGVRAFGIRVLLDETADNAYAYEFHPDKGQVHFSPMPNHPWEIMETRGLVRQLPMVPGQTLHVELIRCGTMLVMYIDDTCAVSTRAYEGRGDGFAFYCQYGSVRVENIQLFDGDAT